MIQHCWQKQTNHRDSVWRQNDELLTKNAKEIFATILSQNSLKKTNTSSRDDFHHSEMELEMTLESKDGTKKTPKQKTRDQ